VACGTIIASGSGAGLTASAGSLALTDGSTYYACVRATDALPQSSAWSCSDGVTIDATVPTMPTPNDGAGTDATSQTSTTQLDANWAAASDGTGSGTTSYDWRFCTTLACSTILASGSGAGTSATAGSLSLTSGDTYYACVRAIDAVGNVSGWSCTDGVLVDGSAPVMTTPTDGVALPDEDFQASLTTLNAIWPVATDDIAVTGYDWRFCTTPACGTIVASGSGASPGGIASSLTLTDGSTYYACARANDDGGNSSAYVCSDGITVDATAPVAATPNDGTAADVDTQGSLSQLDANWSAANDGTGSGAATYDWRFCTSLACGTVIASGSGSGLTATATGLTLSPGTTYYACVTATDAVGNVSVETCSDGVQGADGAPVMTTPTDGATLPDLDFQASTTTLDAIWPAATDDVAVTGYDWRFCSSPACGTILASGSGAGLSASAGSLALGDGSTYYACVRANDAVPQSSAYVCSDGVTVDTAAPVAATPNDGTAADIDTQGSTTQLDANWSAANDGGGSGVATYAWRFCTSPGCGTVLASGSGAGTSASATSLALTPGSTYQVCVAATDALGNASTETCSDGVTVVDSPPTMSTPTDGTSLPDLGFQTSTATLDAIWPAATDDVAVTGYDWQFCTSPACGTIVASGSGAGLSATAGSLTLSNGSTYYACVRANDAAPQSSAYVCSDGVTVDTAGPTTSAPSDGTAADIDSQASLTQLDANWIAANDGSGSGTASYDWRFCTSPACGTILASGSGAGTTATATGLTLTVGSTYYACVRATDQLGNVGAYTCSDGLTVGDPAPTMSTPTDGVALPDEDAQSSTTTLDAIWPAATDNGTVTNYAWRFCTSPTCAGGPIAGATGNTAGLSATKGGLALVSGTTYYACVTATDDASNVSPEVCSDGILIDTTAPSTPTQGGVSGTVSGTVNFTSSSSDAGGVDRVEYRVDGTTRVSASGGGATSYSDPGTPFNTSTLADGNHAWRAFTFDLAGNSTPAGSSTTIIVNNNVEAVMPTGTISSPAAGALAPIQTLTASVGDNGAIVTVEWLLDGTVIGGLALDRPLGGSPKSTSMTSNKTWNTGAVCNGAHTVSVRVTDASGNVYTDPGVAVTKTGGSC
jgi:molybdopterin-binding protein